MRKEDFDVTIFAKRFSELLRVSNENTYTMAQKLGLTPATISRYANGIMAPKLPTLYAIADIFDVNPIWLFGFDAPKYELDKNKSSSNYLRGKTNIKENSPLSKDSALSKSQKELIELFDSAPPELQAAALAVLKSADKD